jgi:cytochrome b561
MVSGYSARQIGLHWLVFLLVAFQFVMGDNMSGLFRAAHGGRPTDVAPIWTVIHIVVGVAILAAMLWRLALRYREGAPLAVPQHPVLEFLAKAVHVGLYADLIGAALVGLAAYFWLPRLGFLHELMTRQILIVLFALHVLGALYHFFVKGDEVMARMVRPTR